MKPINFTNKLEQLKQKQRNASEKGIYKTRRTLKYQKLIATIVKIILSNNDKLLSNKDINEISTLVYNRNDAITKQRIRSMLNNEIVKKDIDNELQRILTDRNIKPLEKTVDLVQKAEDKAKSTSDFIQTARFYKELAEISTNKQTIEQKETIDYSKFDDKGNPQVKVTRSVIQEISTNTPINDSTNETDVKNDSQNENSDAKTE